MLALPDLSVRNASEKSCSSSAFSMSSCTERTTEKGEARLARLANPDCDRVVCDVHVESCIYDKHNEPPRGHQSADGGIPIRSISPGSVRSYRRNAYNRLRPLPSFRRLRSTERPVVVRLSQNSKSKENWIWRAPVPAIGCLNPGSGLNAILVSVDSSIFLTSWEPARNLHVIDK